MIGVLPGHRPAHHHGDGAAVHVLARAGRRADHAGGRVLRRPVRRLDHRDPGQDSRARPPRSSPSSTATPWRSRAAPARRSPSRRSPRCSPARSSPLLIAAAGPPLASIALLFHSADYVSVMLLGLVSAVVLAHGSVLKAMAMIVLGILFGLVGTDTQSGAYRMTMGLDVLFDGLGFVPISMGIFGLAEIMYNIEHQAEARARIAAQVTGLMPSRAGPARLPAGDGARHRGRRRLRHSSGRRADHRGVLRLYAGEEGLEHAGALRQRRDRGRRRARSRQQRGRAGLLHPDAQPRHPAERPDGADDRRA